MALLKFDDKNEADDENSPFNRMTKGQQIQHLPDPIRKNGMNHFAIRKDKPTRRAVFKINAIVMCEQCKVTLHTKSF